MRIYPYLCTFLAGSLLALPAAGQQSNTATSKTVTEVARTTDDLRERILMDRIDELEKRIADLEERNSSEHPGTTAAVATAPALAAAPAAPAAPQDSTTPAPWSIGPVDITGAVDGYYSFNTNHPSTRVNQLYNFNTAANQFDLSLAKITLSHDADPVGFTIDLGYGKTLQLVHCCDNDGGFNKYVEQAYVTWKPVQVKGLQVDFGKFVTSAGAEVIESYKNWNYSRSLLFAWAVPYYHFGLRTAIPVGSHFTGGIQVVNGWNNLVDNNSGKTIGATTAVTFKKWQWATNYYAGPENFNTNTGWRHLIDTTLTLTPWSSLSAYVNYDYGQNRNPVGTFPNLARWQGFAGAIHWQVNSKWSFTPRGEWFRDYQGFSTGVAQALNEVTFTGEYKLKEGLLWRAEYRRDWSDQPFFLRGTLRPCTPPFSSTSCPSGFGLGNTTSQNTVTIGIVVFFGPKR